jgi:flavin reductase (DIM6/NTAB) family NADH-FMN oxidoreductase RutF
MSLVAQTRKSIRRLVLGAGDFPQQCAVGMCDPQSEVAVWLHGLGSPCDVTNSHLMACGAPLLIGVGLVERPSHRESRRLSLHFREHHGSGRLLGKIGLQICSVVPAGDRDLYLFQVRNSRNYCLPTLRLWARYLQYARQRSRGTNSDVPITAREIHAMIVFYICPRPVGLVSVADTTANIFPMNLMGPIGNAYFCFALNSTTPACHLVQRSGSIALSSIPLEQSAVAYQLGKNHRKEYIEWDQLPFATKMSSKLGLPVPEFSLRVREMQIQEVRQLGSHTLFMARTIQDEVWKGGSQFFVVHGIYQARREGMHRT